MKAAVERFFSCIGIMLWIIILEHVGWEDDSTCLLTFRNKDGMEGVALLEDEYQYGIGEEAGKKVGGLCP